MKFSTMAAVAGLSLLSAAPAWPQAPKLDTGNDYLRPCREFVAGGASSYPTGKCAGVVEAIYSMQPFLDHKYRTCPPDGVTLGQIVRVVVNYLESKPQNLHYEFNMLVLAALNSAWPCKQ